MTPIPRTPDAPGPQNRHLAFARTGPTCGDCGTPLPEHGPWQMRGPLLWCGGCDARPTTAPTAQETPTVTPEQRAKHSEVMRAAYARKAERDGKATRKPRLSALTPEENEAARTQALRLVELHGSQARVAALLGVTQGALSQFLRGKTSASQGLARNIASAADDTPPPVIAVVAPATDTLAEALVALAQAEVAAGLADTARALSGAELAARIAGLDRALAAYRAEATRRLADADALRAAMGRAA